MNKFTDLVLGCQTYEKGIKSLLSLITDEITSNKYTRISSCAAYASYRGVVLVRTALASGGTPEFRWLFGLDDCITDPQAIKVAAGTHNAETRIVSVTPGRRFHAKAYLLDHSANESASLIIGSANLTEAEKRRGVNQLMALCDELETKLRQAEADSEKLMNAAVQHVLASISDRPTTTFAEVSA